ncbi:MAG: hypothetical protein WCA19_06300 [Candidatus Acidiferrales bacterium]
MATPQDWRDSPQALSGSNQLAGFYFFLHKLHNLLHIWINHYFH